MRTNGGVTLAKLLNHYGYEFMEQWYIKNIAHTPTFGKYICTTSDLTITGVINHGDVHVEELRRVILRYNPDLIKSLEEVK